MVKDASKPNKVGEHQVKDGTTPTLGKDGGFDGDDSRTERLEKFGKALDASEQLFEQGTKES